MTVIRINFSLEENLTIKIACFLYFLLIVSIYLSQLKKNNNNNNQNF